MPARGETDDYDEEDGNQYDDQVAAYPLEVTVTIEQDVKEKVLEIYQTIRSEHGQENEVLCQTVVYMIKSSRSIDDIKKVLQDYLLDDEVIKFINMLQEELLELISKNQIVTCKDYLKKNVLTFGLATILLGGAAMMTTSYLNLFSME